MYLSGAQTPINPITTKIPHQETPVVYLVTTKLYEGVHGKILLFFFNKGNERSGILTVKAIALAFESFEMRHKNPIKTTTCESRFSLLLYQPDFLS